jgi:hypothetical protein
MLHRELAARTTKIVPRVVDCFSSSYFGACQASRQISNEMIYILLRGKRRIERKSIFNSWIIKLHKEDVEKIFCVLL